MKRRKWHDVEQNSEEWYLLRCGRITSSNYDKICANMGKAFGRPAHEYARKKALEIYTGKVSDITGYKNAHMERGHELEPCAISEYEKNTFTEVRNGGFWEFGNLGDSPDGLIGENGCVEVKSVIPNTHWERIEKGGYDTSYKWQIQGHLYVGGLEFCDFISYCPEFAEGKELYVYRVERNEEMIKQLTERLEEFRELVNTKMSFLLS